MILVKMNEFWDGREMATRLREVIKLFWLSRIPPPRYGRKNGKEMDFRK
jgi:hypothetical protein